MSEDWDEDDNGPTTMTTLTPSFSSNTEGGGGWESATSFGYGHSSGRGGGWGSSNSYGGDEFGGTKSNEDGWGNEDDESGPKFKTMTFTAKGGSSRGGFGGRRGGGRGGFSGENSSRGFGGDRGFGRDRGNRGFGRDYGDRGFGGDRRDHEEGEFGGRKGFDGRNNGFGTRGRREGNEGSGFGSKFNDDQNEDERRGFRGGGGGFSGKGFSRRESSDSNDDTGGGGNKGEETSRREVYIPPPPPEDENSIFKTINVGINFDRYDEIPVDVTGRDPPHNISSFEECNFFPTTKENIDRCHYTRPTPVQKYSIPIILKGRDLMACAQTGSGKTAAFLLPAITRLIGESLPGASRNVTQAPDVLIISPTRELTLQIYNEARKFTYNSIYRPVVIYGGTSVGHQLRQLEGGCNILVCTPGRLVDFLQRRKVLLNNIKIFILDEADRMLDMGFGPEIRKIVDEFDMPPKGHRQTLMFSATFPEEIQQLAADFLEDYLFLTVGRVGGATSDIQQRIIEVGEYEKREKLGEILKLMGTDRTLVFVETKRNADFLASYLSQEGFPTTSIHGDRFQREREEALRDFRTGRTPVLVATSVAARGLDIPEVKHVVNYDLPQLIEEYVHRIGRTGRIGNKGLATAFFQRDKDMALARSLVKVLGDAEQDVPDFLEECAEQAIGTNFGPEGGQFASKDIRAGRGQRGGRGGFGGGASNSAGWGDNQGGFGEEFGEGGTGGGGFNNVPASNEEEEDWG